MAISESISAGVDFRAIFVRRTEYLEAGLTYTVKFSADSSSWVPNAAIPTVLADDGLAQIVSIPYSFFVERKKARFFRVRVSLAP